MSDGSNRTDAAEALLPTASATEALANAVEESRREYDKKVETMEEIDDKAMRSVRTAVILVGLVVSAVSVGGPSSVGEFTSLTVVVGALGIGTLTISIAFGIGVYTATRYTAGIGSTHRSDVIEGEYEYDEWLIVMLRQHDEWSREIEDEIRANQQFLGIVQFSLLLGVLALFLTSGMIVLKSAYGVPPLVPLVVTLLALSVIFTRTF